MSDTIALAVNNRWIENFTSYTVESDIYVADHAFSLELANPEVEITPGAKCQLYVNGQLELTGIIDRKYQRTDKQGRKLVVEGRDLMGLVVDSFCEEFKSVAGMKISDLAAMLLKDVPFINRKQIVVQKDLVGKVKSRRARDAALGLEAIMGASGAERFTQIHPGMTRFQVLQMYALSTGQMFYSLPDGTFVVGRPLVGGEPDYTITFNREGIGNNVISGEVEENISKRYSKITVIGQRQGTVEDGMNLAPMNVGGVGGSVPDPTFPFYKPYVQVSHNDSQTPKQHARLLLEKMRHDGFRLGYEVPGHSQNGINWTINRLVRVKDSVHLVGGRTIDGTFLVSGRTFRLDKDKGATTAIKLSPPGLVEAGSKNGGRR